ncbi:MAG: aminotransferase class III-fold pyridoxal phosphate-dependent enzyme, partial [Pseudomonadota bacterium]
GKIIGGGFPLAALGASKDIMAHFDKAVVGQDKWLMQLGTLSGNPVASVAGLKTMEILRRPGQYDRLRSIGQRLMDMHTEVLGEAGIAHQLSGDATLFDVYFTDADCVDYRSAKHRDTSVNDAWNAQLRADGIFKSPGKLYPSLAITEACLEQTYEAMRAAAKSVSLGMSDKST